MGTFVTMLRNGWTTFVGIAGGFLIYLSQAGLTWPTSQEQVGPFIQGLALAALGFVAKSAMTGSKPH